MKSIIIILFIVGVFFVAYSFRSRQRLMTLSADSLNTNASDVVEQQTGKNVDQSDSSESQVVPKASNTSTSKSILDEQFAPSTSIQSFYKNLFDQKSAFLTYPFANDLIFQNASMAQELNKLKRGQSDPRVVEVPLDELVSSVASQPDTVST